MRALAWLVFVVSACGFPRPADKCDGTCALFAIDRPIASAGEEIWFEGTFEAGAQINFPGVPYQQALDVQSEHRGATTVPPETTAGDLTITTSQGTTAAIPFRRTTFKLTLQPFMSVNEQGDYARTNYLARVHVGGAALTIGNRVYLIGGFVDNQLTGDVEVASAGLDGGLGKPQPVGQLQNARAGHTVVQIDRNVYVIGGAGNGPMQSVERASLDDEGRLSAFAVVPDVQLNEGRAGHASAILGNYVYVFGGRGGNGDLASVERAPIYEDGKLGSFERVDGITLRTSRSYFTVAHTGNQLFAIGGIHDGQPLDSVERMEVYGDGYGRDFEPAGRLLEPRSNHVSVVIGGSVFVIGGKGGARSLTSVEGAPIVMKDTLEFGMVMNGLNEPKQDAALTVVGNYVYVLGGTHVGTAQDEDSNVVERASIIDVGTLDAFSTSPTTMSVPRRLHASVVIGDKLYVIGGHNGITAQDSIEVSTIKPDGTLGGFGLITTKLQTARFGHSALINDDVLYIFGGRDVNGFLDTIETAKINEDGTLQSFVLMTQRMIRARTEFTIFADGTESYLLGGRVTPSGAPTTIIDRAGFPFGTGFGQVVSPYSTIQTRERAATIGLGSWLYVFSGVDGGMYRDTARAPLLPDYYGLANDFMPFSVGLQHPREGHRAVLAGNTLYIIGGEEGMGASPIESTKVASDGSFLPFTVSSTITLAVPRTQHTTVTLGNYVYVIGGALPNGGSSLVSLETATIR